MLPSGSEAWPAALRETAADQPHRCDATTCAHVAGTQCLLVHSSISSKYGRQSARGHTKIMSLAHASAAGDEESDV